SRCTRRPIPSRSAAGTSPRWREGEDEEAARGTTPSTGNRTDRSTSATFGDEPARLRITPTTSIEGSYAAIPATTAPIDLDIRAMSTTSTTGLLVSRATWAVEAKPSV